MLNFMQRKMVHFSTQRTLEPKKNTLKRAGHTNRKWRTPLKYATWRPSTLPSEATNTRKFGRFQPYHKIIYLKIQWEWLNDKHKNRSHATQPPKSDVSRTKSIQTIAWRRFESTQPRPLAQTKTQNTFLLTTIIQIHYLKFIHRVTDLIAVEV